MPSDASPASGPTRVVDTLADASLNDIFAQADWGRLAVAAEATPDLSEGETVVVGSTRLYKIGKAVGQGGMGMIFVAADDACQREVAMKVLRREEIAVPGGCERFLKEARITARLEHPNIVPVHEVGVTDRRRVFYTMKYVRGITLTDVLMGLRRANPTMIEQYPLSRLLNIFQKICDAVAFAHSRGVIHRDLKPENIMLGDFGEVLVLDWGLAEALDETAPATRAPAPPPDLRPVGAWGDPAGATTRVSTTSVQGTPGFIAPERLGADGFAGDARSDIYSLGALLYSLLTLQAPLSGRNMKELVARIVAGEIRSPLAWNEPGPDGQRPLLPHCPGGVVPAPLAEIAMKALATQPTDRYATVRAMQQEIENFQVGRIWHLVVDEDFTGPDVTARWEICGGQHEIRPGDLCIYEGEPQVVMFKGSLPGDSRLECECHQDAATPATRGGFISAIPAPIRTDTPSSGYKFEFGAFDNTVHVLNRVERQLARQRAARPLVRGLTYRVAIERVGARLRATVNDEEIFNLLDPEPLSGADRTAVGIVGWRSRTHIARVRIHRLGAPRLADLLEIAERQYQKGRYPVAAALYEEVLESFPDPEHRERARAGLARTERQAELARNLAAWRQRLERAWPGVPFQLRLGNDGPVLEIPAGSIDSLEPVAGIPLTSISFQNNSVADLAPLREMPLVVFNCTGNRVADLAPLAAAPLESVMCDGCRIESLEPLRGKKLTMLNCADNRIESLEPLRGMPLTFLCCWGNRIANLDPLRGMKLTTLICSANRIESLDPLRGMPITTLICNGNRITSLEPLRGMPLKELHCGDNAIESLEPLRGAELTVLGCHANRISTLEPLRGLSLSVLMCGANRLTGIGFFAGQPPGQFDFSCETIPIQEYEFLRDKWAADFRYAQHAGKLEVLIALRRRDTQRLRELAAEWRGRRYLYVPLYKTWEEARAFCEELGGHLLSITSQEENEFVAGLFPSGCWFWLGLRTTPQGQEWASGEPFAYSNFVDVTQAQRLGPKIFIGKWSRDGVPDAHNCFMIEWAQ